MRLIDFISGYSFFTLKGQAGRELTDYLYKNRLSAEIVPNGNGIRVRIGGRGRKAAYRFLIEKGFPFDDGKLLGLPGFFLSAVARPGIVLGVLLSVAFLLFARTRVWALRIEGDGTIDEDGVRDVLRVAGVSEGMAIRDLDLDAIESACVLRCDLFSSVKVSLDGVTAKVEWVGRKSGETVPVKSIGKKANLVAVSDGVIVSVLPSSGSACVVPGQTVHKGDLLISGVRDGGSVVASGTVIAKVVRTFSVTVPTVLTERKEKGRSACSFSLRLFDENLCSFGALGDCTDVIEWILPGGTAFPFSLRVGYRHDWEEETVVRSEGEVASLALKRLNWEMNAALSEGELLRKEIDGSFSGGAYTASATVEYLINIAQPLEFSVKNE